MAAKIDVVSATAEASAYDEHDDARALALELAHQPGRRSKLRDRRQAADLRAAVEAAAQPAAPQERMTLRARRRTARITPVGRSLYSLGGARTRPGSTGQSQRTS